MSEEKTKHKTETNHEQDLNPEQAKDIETQIKIIKKALVLYATKALYPPDLQSLGQKMLYAVERFNAEDPYSIYKTGLERRELDISLNEENIRWDKIDRESETIALLRLGNFLSHRVKNDLLLITKFGIRKLIIDVRGNAGGNFAQVVETLTMFMDKKNIMLVRRFRNSETIYDRSIVSKNYNGVKDFGEFLNLKLIIVVNKKTASSAEIFAGVMQSWGYKVIGEKTFGKGLVQEPFTLPDGSVLELTTSEILVGENRLKIEGQGVTPDVLVRNIKQTPEDEQLETAIKFLQDNPHRN